MFGSSKPMGSLSSGLLARKGQARPAMRPQGFGGFGGVTQGLDDLGWNDMGGREAAAAELTVQPAAEPVPASEAPLASVAVALAPPVVAAEPAAPVLAAVPDAANEPIPTVLVEREALKAKVEAPVAVKSVSLPTAARLRRETQHAGKAAFTLRVDADRHLRLRIATAITNRSAQDLVTQGLDALLGAIPEVEALVSQLPCAAAPRKSAK
ncbi:MULTISPECIES: hypothetical protein [unclassified Sphingomonas]|uniref:hypothetical protein n=1 Tax=unclassified Sphingomonas TaxID=196159 RepID=UPI002269BB75|nr:MULTISPECIES: hypothetical protein [unclassified Sphingomonas]